MQPKTYDIDKDSFEKGQNLTMSTVVHVSVMEVEFCGRHRIQPKTEFNRILKMCQISLYSLHLTFSFTLSKNSLFGKYVIV